MCGGISHLGAVVQKPQAQEDQERQAPEALQEKSSPGGGLILPGFSAKVRVRGLHCIVVMGRAKCCDESRNMGHSTFSVRLLTAFPSPLLRRHRNRSRLRCPRSP